MTLGHPNRGLPTRSDPLPLQSMAGSAHSFPALQLRARLL
jgi:hypothetical protein